MDMEYIFGQMADHLMECGKIIKWMVTVYINGVMVEFMKVNIKMTKKMVKEHIYGKNVKIVNNFGRADGRKYVGSWKNGK